MKKWFYVGSLCALAVVACSKDEDDGTKTNDTDVSFVSMASMSNSAEVMTGQLAATKGNTAMVRAFGQQMVTEHTAAQADLQGRASQASLAVPDSVDAAHKALLVTLNGLNGRAFDSAYIKSQVEDHAKTIDLFNTEINGGQNQQIRSYASTYLPAIQMHYNRADSIRKAL